jgi:hypothetical protein
MYTAVECVFLNRYYTHMLSICHVPLPFPLDITPTLDLPSRRPSQTLP